MTLKKYLLFWTRSSFNLFSGINLVGGWLGVSIDDFLKTERYKQREKRIELKMYYKEQANKYLYENLKAIGELENIFKFIVK